MVDGDQRAQPGRVTKYGPARRIPIHAELKAALVVLATGQPALDAAKLIVPMLQRFVATDREFARARQAIAPRESPAPLSRNERRHTQT